MVIDTVSSLVAFINKKNSVKFNNLQDMHDHYQLEARNTTVRKKKRGLPIESSDSDSESIDSDNTSNNESIGDKKAKAKKRKTS